MNRTEALAQVLARSRHDPLRFVQEMYPWGQEGTPLERFEGPRDWQRDLLVEIGEHLQSNQRHEPLQVARASGHGIGKSALMAWVAQWGIATTVDARGVVTANTEGQLRTKTWPEMRVWLGLSLLEPQFKLDGTVFRSTDAGHRDTWRIDAIPWSSTNPESFAGLHNQGRRIVVLFDEASAIDEKIWEVTEGALTDSDTEILWLVFGNPTRPTGRFYDCFTTKSHRWSNDQIDSRAVDGTNKAQLQAWVEDYGEDHDFVRVRVRGMFPRSAANQLISTDNVTDAQARDGDVVPKLRDPLILGVDVARMGGDESVLMWRKGRAAAPHETRTYRQIRTPALKRRVAEAIQETRPDYVFIDGGGPGGPLCDMLIEDGYDVREVAFGGRADDDEYANKRAEMWARMRDWLDQDSPALPWDDAELRQQLIQQTYTFRENKTNDLILTSKQQMRSDGLDSPDRADALALTFAENVEPLTTQATHTGPSNNDRVARTDYREGWT